jgi:hypothetical protein
MTVEPYRVERRMAFSSTTADIARVWRGEPRGPVRVGSDAHKALFCRMLLETFNRYRPAAIDWLTLSENARRMSTFDPGLLRPGFLSALADTALASLRLWSVGTTRDGTRR